MSAQTYSCTVPKHSENYSKTLLVSACLFLLAAGLLAVTALQVENTGLQIIAGALAIPFAASAALAFWVWGVSVRND